MSAIDRLVELQRNRKQYENGAALDFALRNDNVLRGEIDFLAEKFLNKKIAGCINCYTDAYFELLTLDKKMAIEKQKCVFRLRAGALIKDINGDRSKMMSNHNITNELALYHLRTNPQCWKFFDKPTDIAAAIREFENDDKTADDVVVRRGRKPRKNED